MRTSDESKQREYYRVSAELKFRFLNYKRQERRDEIKNAIIEVDREHPWVDQDNNGNRVKSIDCLWENHDGLPKDSESVFFHIFPGRLDMHKSQIYAYEKYLRYIGEKVAERFLELQEFEIVMTTQRCQLCNKVIRKVSKLPVSTLIKHAANNMNVATVPQLLEKSMDEVKKWRTIGYGSLAQLIVVLVDAGETDGILLAKDSVLPYLQRSEFYVELQRLDNKGHLTRRFKRWFNEMIRDENQQVPNRPNRKVFIKPFVV